MTSSPNLHPIILRPHLLLSILLAPAFWLLASLPLSAQYNYIMINTNPATLGVMPQAAQGLMSSNWSAYPARSNVSFGNHDVSGIRTASVDTVLIGGVALETTGTNWAHYPALTNVNVNSNNVSGVVTISVDAITMGGVTITNWYTPTPVITPPASVTGEVTLALDYDNAGWSAGVGGTVYFYAWHNRLFNGFPSFTTSLVVTAGTSALQSDPTLVIKNTAGLNGDTWWYAWFDADGDGELNHGAFYGNSAEPAALAEYCPIRNTAATNDVRINFVMVDQKGGTFRFTYPTSSEHDPRKGIDIYSLGGGKYKQHMIQGIIGRNLFCEQDYLATNSAPYNAVKSIGGAWWDLWGGGGAYEIQALYYPYTADECEGYTNYTAFTIAGGGTLSGVYPTGGETVYSNTIPFAWTGTKLDYSACELNVYLGTTNTDQIVYGYTNYMENQHWDDATTHHLMATNRGGPVLMSGSNYCWEVRCLFGATAASHPPTDFSPLSQFVYTNAP